jgi:hypothetical protein
MFRCTEWEILEAMEMYGGSFVQQLARLYRAADADNRQTLAASFAKYFTKYDDLAAARKEKQS